MRYCLVFGWPAKCREEIKTNQPSSIVKNQYNYLEMLLGLGLLCLSFQLTAASPYPAVDVPMTPIQVSEHSYYVRGLPRVATENAGFVSNAGFVVTEEGIVVFDTLGTPALGYKLLEIIREISDAPIKRVYISHYHADHFYGTEAFVETGAEIISSTGAQQYLGSDTAMQRLEERRISLFPWVDDHSELIFPDRYLEAEETYSIGGVDLRIVNVGSAHSDGDMIMFVEQDAVLFSGDIIFRDRIPFLGSANSGAWLELLDQMATADVTAIIPGHGTAAPDPAEMVSLTRDYLAFVREQMKLAVDDWVPFDEAYEAIDWGDFAEYPAFNEANRRNAYGVYLSLEQESIEAQ